MEAETYKYRPAKNDNGTFFYTDCGNQMYVAENNPMRYHGKLCPKCLCQGRRVTLYLRGTKEANDIIDFSMKISNAIGVK